MTGLSRAQLTRLIGQHRETGRIEDRRGGAPACPFERRYTRTDIRLLAAVDAAMGQMSGPATRALMRRQYEVFGDERFERLAGLSNGHLYNLRRSVTYRRRRTVVAKTQATHNAIGQRRNVILVWGTDVARRGNAFIQGISRGRTENAGVPPATRRRRGSSGHGISGVSRKETGVPPVCRFAGLWPAAGETPASVRTRRSQ